MPVEIRPFTGLDEVQSCEEIQFHAWQMFDYREVVPLHMLVATVRGGGVLLGAFEGGQLLGFVFGFPAVTGDGQLKHYSHMLAVHPERQAQGLGWQLKLAQRDALLDRGVELITWTYDPLLSANAHLNLAKLGAWCRTYIRDLYGSMADGLNAGLPTDRLEVEWWIASDHVAQCLGGPRRGPTAEALVANTSRPVRGGFRAPGDMDLRLDLPAIQIEVPYDYQAMRTYLPGLALEWRLAGRELFETYFSAGYAAVHFHSQRAEGGGRSYYVLARDVAAV